MQFLNDPAMQKRLVDIGVIVTPMNQKDFNAFMATELVKWTKLVKDSGAKVN
jgi:tripartite-type tricarboxylate transporter receptor subunit TctC